MVTDTEILATTARIFGTTVCGVGITVNFLSLSYFLKNCKKGLGTRLLMLLNFWDSIVVLFGFSNRILMFEQNIEEGSIMSYYAIAFVHMLAYDCTGFSTCLISVTRTIKVCRPFYRLKRVWVAGCFILFFTYSFSREFMCYYPIFTNKDVSKNAVLSQIRLFYPLIVSMGVTLYLITVSVSTLITAYWLFKRSYNEGEISENARHASVTIIILSAVFCLLNISYIVAAILALLVKLGQIQDTPKLQLFRFISFEAAYSLNSTLNPIIYLTRKSEMRQFVLNIWRTIRTYLSRLAANLRDQEVEQANHLRNLYPQYKTSRL